MAKWFGVLRMSALRPMLWGSCAVGAPGGLPALLAKVDTFVSITNLWGLMDHCQGCPFCPFESRIVCEELLRIE